MCLCISQTVLEIYFNFNFNEKQEKKEEIIFILDLNALLFMLNLYNYYKNL